MATETSGESPPITLETLQASVEQLQYENQQLLDLMFSVVTEMQKLVEAGQKQNALYAGLLSSTSEQPTA